MDARAAPATTDVYDNIPQSHRYAQIGQDATMKILEGLMDPWVWSNL